LSIFVICFDGPAYVTSYLTE